MKDNYFDYIVQLRQHVAKSERNDEDRRLSLHAISAFERAMNSHVLSETDLSEIMAAAKSKHLGPFYIGTDLLASLFGQFPDIEKSWFTLSQSPFAHERWVAITSLDDERIPIKFAERLIKDAINDKSSKVRFFAIERVYTRKLYSLVQELSHRLSFEKNQKVLQHGRWVISMLEKHYHFLPNGTKESDLPGDIDLPIKEIIATSIPPQHPSKSKSHTASGKKQEL